MRLPNELKVLRNDKIAIEFFHITGLVMSEKKWAETHVHSPRGVVNNGTGYIPGVSSTVTTKSEIWLKTDDGEEIPLQLSNINFPVREGQTVSAVWGIPSGKRNGPYVFLINHTSAQSVVLSEGIMSILGSKTKAGIGCFAAAVIGIITFSAVTSIAMAITDRLTLGVACLYLAVPISVQIVYRKLMKFYGVEEKLLNDHLRSIGVHLDQLITKAANA